MLKLYIYDCCPYCVRARMVFGLKRIEHELVFLAFHDERTPLALIGAKQTPILQLPSGEAFAESMDIVRYVDEHYGGPALLKEASGRQDLQQWLEKASKPIYFLHVPRIIDAPFAEFAQKASRDYIRKKKEAQTGPMGEHIAKTTEYLAAVNEALVELESLLASTSAVNADGVCYDDIVLFGSLRILTMIQGVEWPPKVRAYVEYFSEGADIPLLDAMIRA